MKTSFKTIISILATASVLATATGCATTPAPESSEFDPYAEERAALGEATDKEITTKTDNFTLSLLYGEYSNGKITEKITLKLTDSENNTFERDATSPALSGTAPYNHLPDGSGFKLIAAETDVYPLFAALMVPISEEGNITYFATFYCFDGNSLDLYFPKDKIGQFFPLISDANSVVIRQKYFAYTDDETGNTVEFEIEGGTMPETNSKEATQQSMPAPFSDGTDGDAHSTFYQPCRRVLDNIPVELMRLRDDAEVEAWINSFTPIYTAAPDSISDYANIYSFVTHFNITREEAENALSVYLTTDDEQIKITKEELDVIFSGDIGAITKEFASEYSIVSGEHIYSPSWVYSHTAEDYKSAGITPQDIAEKTTLYMAMDLTDDAKAALEAKLSDTEEPALSLLNCSANEDGAFCIDQTAWKSSDDYTLFRKYFFGTWEGNYRFPEYPEQTRLIIDDSEKSFVMTESGIRVLDGFYETGVNALAFMIGSDSGSAIIWINLDEPDTIYMAWGGMTSPLWSRNESGEYSTAPVVYALRKADVPLNEPQDNFLSIFRLREMAQEYGIDNELLVNIEYESDGTTLYHDDWYRLYPMYLVSEAEDKIVIRTTVGNADNIDMKPVEVICTFEKADGEWNRSVELI